MCPTCLPREHRKITRSNTKATSDLRSKEDQQIMQSMTIRPKHGISVRSPQAPGPPSRSALAAGEGATTLGDHPFSLITCVRVSCASNAGKLEVGSHSWRSLFVPACPGNGFSLREPGYWYTVFFSTSPRGLRGPSKPAGDIGDKLGSGMPAANVAGPNLQRTNPSVRSKTD